MRVWWFLTILACTLSYVQSQWVQYPKFTTSSEFNVGTPFDGDVTSAQSYALSHGWFGLVYCTGNDGKSFAYFRSVDPATLYAARTVSTQCDLWLYRQNVMVSVSTTFSPSIITISAGDTVTWNWLPDSRPSVGHTVTSCDEDGIPDGLFCSMPTSLLSFFPINYLSCSQWTQYARIAPYSYSHTFNDVGIFPYTSLTDGNTARGTIIVQGPAPTRTWVKYAHYNSFVGQDAGGGPLEGYPLRAAQVYAVNQGWSGVVTCNTYDFANHPLVIPYLRSQDPATLFFSKTYDPNCDLYIYQQPNQTFPTPPPTPPPVLAFGRYVTIVGTSASVCLSVAELAIYGVNGTNLATSKPVNQSGYWDANQFPSGNLIDGNIHDFAHTSCGHNGAPLPFPYPTNVSIFEWMIIDIGSDVNIASIQIWNREDCCQDRLGSGVRIQIYNNAKQQLFISNPLTVNPVQLIAPAPTTPTTLPPTPTPTMVVPTPFPGTWVQYPGFDSFPGSDVGTPLIVDVPTAQDTALNSGWSGFVYCLNGGIYRAFFRAQSATALVQNKVAANNCNLWVFTPVTQPPTPTPTPTLTPTPTPTTLPPTIPPTLAPTPTPNTTIAGTWVKYPGFDSFSGANAGTPLAVDVTTAQAIALNSSWVGFAYCLIANGATGSFQAFFRVQNATALVQNKVPASNCNLWVFQTTTLAPTSIPTSVPTSIPTSGPGFPISLSLLSPTITSAVTTTLQVRLDHAPTNNTLWVKYQQPGMLSSNLLFPVPGSISDPFSLITIPMSLQLNSVNPFSMDIINTQGATLTSLNAQVALQANIITSGQPTSTTNGIDIQTGDMSTPSTTNHNNISMGALIGGVIGSFIAGGLCVIVITQLLAQHTKRVSTTTSPANHHVPSTV